MLATSLALLVALGACDRLKRKSDNDDRAAVEATATAEEPKPSKSEATVVQSGSGYAVGDAVLVEWRGSWYKSTILEVRGAEYKIHYTGWGAEWDEVVGPSRIKPQAASSSVTIAQSWNVGDRVQVQWKGAWYPATILAVANNGYRVHYDGYGSNWDEFVAPYRVKAR
jgi:sRNA-binding protein